jgi:hypothetical protein
MTMEELGSELIEQMSDLTNVYDKAELVIRHSILINLCARIDSTRIDSSCEIRRKLLEKSREINARIIELSVQGDFGSEVRQASANILRHIPAPVILTDTMAFNYPPVISDILGVIGEVTFVCICGEKIIIKLTNTLGSVQCLCGRKFSAQFLVTSSFNKEAKV